MNEKERILETKTSHFEDIELFYDGEDGIWYLNIDGYYNIWEGSAYIDAKKLVKELLEIFGDELNGKPSL